MINRNNYEEYFILYMDNELDQAGRTMVESFVAQHSDLKEELDLLMQYRFEPDTSVVFNGKEDLLRVNGETPVTLSNAEEWLLLYLDNELDEQKKRMVEEFVLAHPQLAIEFELLKKARLQPETIMFPGKASLYRKEERDRRVFWWRIAAAAVLLIAVLTATLITRDRNTDRSTASSVKETPALVKPVQPVIDDHESSPESPALVQQKSIKNDASVETPTAANVKKEQTSPVSPDRNKNKPGTETNEVEQQIAKSPVINPTNNLPTPVRNPNLKPDQSSEMANNTPVVNKPSNRDAINEKAVTTQDSQPSNVQWASTAVPAEETIGETSEKKNRNRGIFRKIARTFEKRTNIDPTTDDDRLLVAGFAIRLK